MAIDPRFLAESGREVFTGNELLVKGALETEGGVHLLTGYPGSPVAGFFDVLGDIARLLKKNGVRAFQANNEALGGAAVNGSQMAAVPRDRHDEIASACTSPPTRWRSATSPARIPKAARSSSCGEDPWCDSHAGAGRLAASSSSTSACRSSSRARSQELKDWIDLSFKLSQAAGLYIGYIVTTAQADGGGTVECRPNQFPTINTKQRDRAGDRADRPRARCSCRRARGSRN